jgi:hypothetical protein
MKRMYEFVCESGHRMDKLTNYEMVEVQCVCGGLAHRVVSVPNFNLEGWSGHFPSAHGRFDKRHTDKLKAEQKANS